MRSFFNSFEEDFIGYCVTSLLKAEEALTQAQNI